MRDPSEKTSPNFLAGRACADLGSSGIKFEVEGGEGSPGADTYIPPPKKLQSCFIFHRNSTARKKGPGGPFFDKTDSLVLQRLLCSIAEIVGMYFFFHRAQR